MQTPRFSESNDSYPKDDDILLRSDESPLFKPMPLSDRSKASESKFSELMFQINSAVDEIG